MSTSSSPSDLPVATASILGGIKVGSGLAITNTGVLSATGASANTYLSTVTRPTGTNNLLFTLSDSTTVTLNGVLGSNAFNSTSIPTTYVSALSNEDSDGEPLVASSSGSIYRLKGGDNITVSQEGNATDTWVEIDCDINTSNYLPTSTLRWANIKTFDTDAFVDTHSAGAGDSLILDHDNSNVELTTGTVTVSSTPYNAIRLNVNASQTQITAIGTITTGTWNATKIASAYLDDDTAHLSGTQTFTGTKTFKAETGNANLYLESVTDNAFVIIDSNTDNLGTEQSGIIFRDNGANKWLIGKDTGNDFYIYDYTRVATVFEILDNGDATFSVNLNADEGLTVTGNISVTGTVDGRDIATDGTTLDGIYTSITGDIAITSGGVATIQANSVALATDTTGNYVASIIGGEGITSSGAATGEGINHSLSVNLNDFVAKTSIVDADLIAIVDSADSNNNKKITFSNFKSSINEYIDWNLWVDGTEVKDVTSTDNVKFEAGQGISLSYESDVVTIESDSIFNGLSDPNADRIPYWNDSAGIGAWITIGSGLSWSGGTLDTAAVTVDRFTNIVTDESRTGTPLTAGSASDTLDFLGGDAISTSSSQTGSVVTLTFHHDDTSTQASVNNSGRTYIQDITLDGYGHITGISSATETVTNTDVNWDGSHLVARLL